MKKLQEVFNRIQQSKKSQKDIRSQYKDALDNNQEYQIIKEKLERLKEEKKAIEMTIQSQMGNAWTALENLKEDIKSDQELLSDIAVTQLMEGESVEVTDENENEYEPQFSVRFKKIR